MNTEVIKFVEGKEIRQYPSGYDWEIIEAFNSKGIKFSDKFQYLDFVDKENSGWVLEWQKNLKKTGKAFIFAKGVMKDCMVRGIKENTKKNIKKRLEDGKNIKKTSHCIPIRTVYGLFAKTDD